MTRRPDGGSAPYIAKVTPERLPDPRHRPERIAGRSSAATICYKVYDGLRNFQRHPTEPTTGHARAGLALREPDAALSAVRNEDQQAAEQAVRIVRVVLLQGPPVAVRCDGEEDRSGVGSVWPRTSVAADGRAEARRHAATASSFECRSVRR